MVVSWCRQATSFRTSAKRSREETESRMSEVKRHRNTPLWREIDSLRSSLPGVSVVAPMRSRPSGSGSSLHKQTFMRVIEPTVRRRSPMRVSLGPLRFPVCCQQIIRSKFAVHELHGISFGDRMAQGGKLSDIILLRSCATIQS